MRSSINLRICDIPKLYRFCDSLSVDSSHLINSCLRKFLSSFQPRIGASLINRLVEYQPKGVGYRIFNLVFDVDVYNLAVNFRVYSRLSVSKMVTMAIEKYLDEDAENREPDLSHNYFEYKHFRRHNTDKVSTKWIVEWNIWMNGEKKE